MTFATVLLWDLSADRLRFLWSELAENPDDAKDAVRRMASVPDVLPWIADQVRKVAQLETKAAPLLVQLDDDFAKREKASADLAALGTAVRSVLEMALADKPSTEARRRLAALVTNGEKSRSRKETCSSSRAG